MKKFLFFLGLVAFSSHAETMRVKARFWSSDCQATQVDQPSKCGLPLAAAPAQEKDLTWSEATSEGGVSPQSLDLDVLGFGLGKLTLFHVFPHATLKQPKYFQMRFEWIAPHRGLCMQSVRQRYPAEIPPLICSTWLESEKKMYGVTLEFSNI